MKHVAVIALGFLLASAGAAEELRLKSGRILDVASHRIEGDLCILTMKNGRERSIPRRWLAEDPPADPAPAAVAPPPQSGGGKVFTNDDLSGQDAGSDSPSGAAGARRDARAADASSVAEEKVWSAWRGRYERAQARVDAAQAEADRLDAISDKANGDVDTTSDGSKIQGVGPGRGYYIQAEAARRRLTAAQADLDKLRDEAHRAGVPPGIVR